MRRSSASARQDRPAVSRVSALDGLLAEVQLRGYLRVGLALDDESCHLQFAFGEGLDADCVGLPWPGAPVHAVAEPSQLPLRGVAVVQRTARVEFRGCALKFGDGTVPLAGFSECATRKCARQRCPTSCGSTGPRPTRPPLGRSSAPFAGLEWPVESRGAARRVDCRAPVRSQCRLTAPARSPCSAVCRMPRRDRRSSGRGLRPVTRPVSPCRCRGRWPGCVGPRGR